MSIRGRPTSCRCNLTALLFFFGAQGKTAESRKDLDRLAIIRKQREEEAAARAVVLAEKEAAKGGKK